MVTNTTTIKVDKGIKKDFEDYYNTQDKIKYPNFQNFTNRILRKAIYLDLSKQHSKYMMKTKPQIPELTEALESNDKEKLEKMGKEVFEE